MDWQHHPHWRNWLPGSGWQLVVNKNLASNEAAINFVQYMTSPELQKASAIERSLLPTRPAVYDDPDVLKATFLPDGGFSLGVRTIRWPQLLVRVY